VEGVVVDGVDVVAVVVDGVVEDEPDAALAIAAPPPAITPATPSAASAKRNRLIRSLTSSVRWAVLGVNRCGLTGR